MNLESIQCERKEANECRFQHMGCSSTLVAYPPIYDANGVNTNPDMNTTTFGVRCRTCGRHWIGKTRGGETTITETT